MTIAEDVQRMPDATVARVQVRVTLPERFLAVIDPVRVRWDPRRAASNPAHATLIYHDELHDLREYAARVRTAALQCATFTLVVQNAERFAPPDAGAYLRVDDPAGAVAALRARVLHAPSTPRQRYGLHVTLLHPSVAHKIEAAWPDVIAIPALGAFRVTELQLVDEHNAVFERVPLGEA